MHRIFLIIFLCMVTYSGSMAQDGFLKKQKEYPRVRTAYDLKWETLKNDLSGLDIDTSSLRVYIRVFKHEKELELWISSASREDFILFKKYSICRLSGHAGPKRREGDLQVPEGFYHISAFNPWSNFHLSLCINYPNASDLKFADSEHPGGNICIHGNCVTIGCVPMTDDKIREIYLLCIEARAEGQGKIPVTIFPAHPGTDTFIQLSSDTVYSKEARELWTELQLSDKLFIENKKLPRVQFLSNGRHRLTMN